MIKKGTKCVFKAVGQIEELVARSGQRCTVVRMLSEIDPEEGQMYTVVFDDDFIAHVYENELTPMVWMNEGLPSDNVPCNIICKGWKIPFPRWAYRSNGTWYVLDDENDAQDLALEVDWWMVIPELNGAWLL